MKTKSIFERLRDGETILSTDPDGYKLREASFATKELLVKMNNSSNPKEIRDLLSQITGSDIDKSVDVLFEELKNKKIYFNGDSSYDVGSDDLKEICKKVIKKLEMMKIYN